MELQEPPLQCSGSHISKSITIGDIAVGLSGVVFGKGLGRIWHANELRDDPRFLREYLAEIETFARKTCHAYSSDQEPDAAIYRVTIRASLANTSDRYLGSQRPRVGPRGPRPPEDRKLAYV